MSGKLLRNQADISNQTPMPTERLDDSSTVSTISAETLTWFYSNSGVWASATGQAAGTIVTGRLTYDGILNSIKAVVGHADDTSLSLGVSTRLDTLINVPESIFDQIQHMSVADQVTTITPFLSTNGYYAVDHRRGQIWGIAKAVVADDAVTYSVKAPVTGGSVGSSETEADIVKLGGETLGDHDTAVIDHGIQPLWEAKDYDGSALPNNVAEGDAVRPAATLYGVPYAYLVGEDGSTSPYDPTSQSFKSTNLNPTPTAFGVLLQEDISNIPVATPAVRYIDVEGVGEIVVQYDIVTLPTGPGTLTLEIDATAENNGTAAASCAYVDIAQYGTECLTGAAAATFTADAAVRINCKGLKFLKFTITATAADDGDASLYINKAY